MRSPPYNVLFLCTGNSARSIMAESIMNREGAGRFKAFSAGSKPTGEVHRQALALLRRKDYRIDGLRSKSWDEFSSPEAPDLDFVFTVCDRAAVESCPAWSGRPMRAHWSVPDPAGVDGETETALAFEDAYRLLADRIASFVDLPIASLDGPALQERLDEIGGHTDR